MQHFLSILLPVLLLSFEGHVRGQSARASVGSIYVTNGQSWGIWGGLQMCSTGTYATGFALRVDRYRGLGYDDTTLNGISLRCTPPRTPSSPTYPYTTVNSAIGSVGTVTADRWCPGGQLVAFQLRVQPRQGVFGDDTAANNIRFRCTGGQVLEGNGESMGDWGSWSDTCAGKGICGIQTRVQPPQGVLDDSALNDVQFFCCT